MALPACMGLPECIRAGGQAVGNACRCRGVWGHAAGHPAQPVHACSKCHGWLVHTCSLCGLCTKVKCTGSRQQVFKTSALIYHCGLLVKPALVKQHAARSVPVARAAGSCCCTGTCAALLGQTAPLIGQRIAGSRLRHKENLLLVYNVTAGQPAAGASPLPQLATRAMHFQAHRGTRDASWHCMAHTRHMGVASKAHEGDEPHITRWHGRVVGVLLVDGVVWGGGDDEGWGGWGRGCCH